MVDAVGGMVASDLRIATTQRVVTPAAPTTPAVSTGTTPPALAGVAKAMAASPPVDTDRVAQIKAAIADGTYPIFPETVADRLIAYSLNWK